MVNEALIAYSLCRLLHLQPLYSAGHAACAYADSPSIAKKVVPCLQTCGRA
jgi:hypothetical protein